MKGQNHRFDLLEPEELDALLGNCTINACTQIKKGCNVGEKVLVQPY